MERRMTRRIRTRSRPQQRTRSLAVLFALSIFPVVALATGPQEKLATSYIMAAASGDPAALLGLYHPGELEDLRLRILKALELEEQQGGNAIRSRLFGAAASIEEIRRLTPDNFYLNVARAVMLPPERIEEVRILGIVEENSQLSHAVARVLPPKDANARPRIAVVSLIRYGKEWRVQLPTWLQVRVDSALAAPAGSSGAARPSAPRIANSPDIMSALIAGSAVLRAGDCAAYFNEHMSPNFRSTTSVKALSALVKQCETREETRETYIDALEIAQRLSPKLEQDGNRAVYDMRGQGLPFERFVLEKLNGNWYVAE
jgi:hypothetical protein